MYQTLGNNLSLGNIRGGGTLKLPHDFRDRHLYVCGASRSGKSKLLEHLIRQDIENHWKSGCGMLLIDWHGELYDNVMRWLAWHDIEKELPVIPIDLRKDDSIISYNLLRKRNAYASVVVGNLIQDMAYVWGQGGTDSTPLFARIASNIFHALYELELTLIDSSYLTNREVTRLRRAITDRLRSTELRQEWEYFNGLKPEKLDEQFSSTVSRLRRFVENPLMRGMFGQSGDSLQLLEAWREGHIILVSLARGEGHATTEDAETFATLLLSDLWSAAQERGKGPQAKPFYVYLDEFQRFVTPTLGENLDEAGGFGLHLTMAHQFPSQLLDRGEAGRKVYNSIMANAGTKIVFRTAHQGDLEPLARELFTGVMDPDEIKLILESTKVMDYVEETQITSSSGSGGSTSTATHADDDDNEHMVTSDGESWNSVETERQVLRPVLGKERSGVYFRPLEEQLHRAVQHINTQAQRECIVRIAETRQPVFLRTPTVMEGFADQERIDDYCQSVLSQWRFVVSMPEATQRLEARQSELEKRFLPNEAEEAPTSRRPVRRPKKKPT